jgi:hypothetical protein
MDFLAAPRVPAGKRAPRLERHRGHKRRKRVRQWQWLGVQGSQHDGDRRDDESAGTSGRSGSPDVGPDPPQLANDT